MASILSPIWPPQPAGGRATNAATWALDGAGRAFRPATDSSADTARTARRGGPMKNLERGELYRLIALNLAVLLEGAALLSILLRIGLLPIGTVYGNIVSVAVWVLPTVVGLLARRFEAAILLAGLPFWLIPVCYLPPHTPPRTFTLFRPRPLSPP